MKIGNIYVLNCGSYALITHRNRTRTQIALPWIAIELNFGPNWPTNNEECIKPASLFEIEYYNLYERFKEDWGYDI